MGQKEVNVSCKRGLQTKDSISLATPEHGLCPAKPGNRLGVNICVAKRSPTDEILRSEPLQTSLLPQLRHMREAPQVTCQRRSGSCNVRAEPARCCSRSVRSGSCSCITKKVGHAPLVVPSTFEALQRVRSRSTLRWKSFPVRLFL